MKEDNFKLSASQKDAIGKLTAWWEGDTQDIILSGAPGTGKTFLAKYFANSLKKAVPLFTAPTNEAVRQLELSLDSTSNCKTTYSALGLRLSTRSFKQSIYQAQLPEDFYDYNMLVIDEASMAGLAKKGEPDQLIDYVKQCGMRTVWLGDWAQLPPVNAENGKSPIFEMGIETIELTEVQRHKGDILRWAFEIRDILKKPIRNLPKNTEGIQIVKASNSFNFGLDSFNAVVEDEARILVWTNKASSYCLRPGVKEYNEYIRAKLFGEAQAKASPVHPTDKILFASPLFITEDPFKLTAENLIKEEFFIKASVNTRAEVLKTEVCKIMGIPVLRTSIELESGANTECFIPTNGGQILKAKFEESLTKEALNCSNKRKAGDLWHYLHTFRGVFADIKYTYAITGHRAQGSTVTKVFVDTANILQNRDRLVAFKNLYVCGTRAQKELTLFV